MKDDSGFFNYKELIKFTGYTAKGEKLDVWQGIECGGDIKNNIYLNIGSKEEKICEFCSNQVNCLFSDKSGNNFQMEKVVSSLYREHFNKWVYRNSHKYKIELENPQKYL